MNYSDISRWCGANELTTFRGGGRAFAYFPRIGGEFLEVLTKLMREERRPYILGGGSNTVISDGELDAPIICTRHMRGLTFEGSTARFEAGVTVAELMREARARGLGGLEFLEGVPATLGGALRMNAGAFGCQMSEFAIRVELLAENEGGYALDTRTPRFAYRRGEQGIILGGEMRLLPMSAQESMARRAEFLARRRAKQPRQPSCGSVFKNATMSRDEAEKLGLLQYANAVADGGKNAICGEKNVVLPAGRLIDACGLKGAREGGAMISDLHANFIVNLGGATAGDFLALAVLAEQAVYEKFAIRLAREFVLLT